MISSMYVANVIVLLFSSSGVLFAMLYGKSKSQRGWFFLALSLLVLAVVRFAIEVK